MDLHKITYLLVTGASKGIGKCMAIEICKKIKSGSVAVLIARSEQGLLETQNDILSQNNEISVKTFSADCHSATSETYENIIKKSLLNRNINDFETAFIVHNVGSIGDVTKKAKETDDIAVWTEYYNLNVFSVASLNSQFINIFKSIKKLIVNITSKCGIVPYKSMTFYCSGKAAREMYFRVLAEEEEDIIVLNYSPGPVDTDMNLEIQNNSGDNDIKSFFKNLRDKKEILSPIQTTTKMLNILEAFTFKSGDHLDYFD